MITTHRFSVGTLGLVATCLLATPPAHAADLHVPGDAPSIPAAIALAQEGDTIHVAPGTWAAAVDFAGKTLHLVSDAGFGTTTIDGGAAGWAVTIPVAPGSSTLEGFTIVGGTQGRVLMADDANASRCRIGGGPLVGVQTVYDPTTLKRITDCLIQGNARTGILGSGFTLVERCLIDGNGAPDSPANGGITSFHKVQVVDSIIANNTAQQGGGAADLRGAEGTLFLRNHATLSIGGYAGFVEDLADVPPLFKDCAFIGNTAPSIGGAWFGPGFNPGELSVTLSGCTFADNRDEEGNIGLSSFIQVGLPNPFTTVDRCTFVGNRVELHHEAYVSNTIVRGASPAIVGNPQLVVSWSDIEGGWPGTGNFDAGPGFVDAAHDVYALLPGSPCVDAGDPDAPLDPDGSIADVGALSLAPFAVVRVPKFGLHGLPGLEGTGTLQGGSPLSLTLERARPGAAATLVLGVNALHAPFKGGTLVPQPQILVPGLAVSGAGTLTLAGTWPAGIPSGIVGWAQMWIADAAATQGLAASNGLGLVAP